MGFSKPSFRSTSSGGVWLVLTNFISYHSKFNVAEVIQTFVGSEPLLNS
jgi:hypothetical protein